MYNISCRPPQCFITTMIFSGNLLRILLLQSVLPQSRRKNGDDENFTEQHLKNPETSRYSSVRLCRTISFCQRWFLSRALQVYFFMSMGRTVRKSFAFRSDSNSVPDPSLTIFYLQARRGLLVTLEWHEVTYDHENSAFLIFSFKALVASATLFVYCFIFLLYISTIH